MAGQYGQFTGYEPLPDVPGAYNFQLANGGQRTFVGPEAEALRAKIDAVPDQRTAEFKPGDALAAFGGGPARSQRATGAGGAYRPGAGPAAAPQAAPPAPNQFNPLVTTKGGGQMGLREGGDPANPLDYVVREQGRAATKGGLALRSQASQGGYQLDPERLDELDESQREIQTAARHSAVEARKAADERQAFFTAARQQASSEAVQAARENSLREQGVADIRARYDAAEKDFLEAPDKQKSAREGNKGKTFVEALAMSLGALGAAMARTPNFAAQTIEANRERELRREEAELRVKKEAKDSLYGRLRDEMGSAELAKTAWRAIRTKQDMLALEQVATKSGDLKQQQEILATAGLQNQGYLKYMEALERGAQGEISKQFVNVPGQSGSRGGNRAPTIDELKGLAGLRKDEAEIGKLRADASNTSTGRSSPVPGERTGAIAGAGNAIDAAIRIERNIVDRGMGEDNTLDDPLSGGIDAFVRGASSAVGGDRTKQDSQLRADTFALARGAQLALGKSDNDARLADEMAEGGANAADRLRAARDIKARAIKEVQANLATLPPAQARQLIRAMSPEAQKELLGK